MLKGSRIETIDSDSIPLGIKDIRKKAPIDQNSILQKDILFRSPSYASAFEIGGHVNGLVEWKTEDVKTLKNQKTTRLVNHNYTSILSTQPYQKYTLSNL